MKPKTDEGGKTVPTTKVDAAARLAKNSIAMFAGAAFAKAGGLVTTILVARYLGASSLGAYAVILAVALLLGVISPMGQQEVIVRAVARDRSLMFKYWVNASVVALLFAASLGASLATITAYSDFEPAARVAIYVAVIGLPIAGLNFVAQAVLQGLERMEHQPIGTFFGWMFALPMLWLLLHGGAGIWAAFAARIVFQLTSLVILARAILQLAARYKVPHDWAPHLSMWQATLPAAMPFALQRFLTEGLVWITVIILPLLVTLEAVGFFNAASQVTQITAMIIPMVASTILPLFSRAFKQNPTRSGWLADQTVKFLLLVIFPFAFLVTVAAGKIIFLLYGDGYLDSVPVLQLVIWSQVFVAADSVMKQSMIASDNVRAMVWRSIIGVITHIALTVTLGKLFGLFGIAIAAVVASAFLMTIDTRFVTRHVYQCNLIQVVAKPFLAALAAGIAAFVLIDEGLLLLSLASVLVYLISLVVLKVFTPEERSVFAQLFQRLRARLMSW